MVICAPWLQRCAFLGKKTHYHTTSGIVTNRADQGNLGSEFLVREVLNKNIKKFDGIFQGVGALPIPPKWLILTKK